MEEKTYIAKLNNVRISPRKLRLVVNMVKELEIEAALDQLEFLNKRGAKYVQKALKSASANAKNQANLKMKELKISEMFVTEAMTYKRGKPVARGRYHMIRRRGSNLTVKLTQATQ